MQPPFPIDETFNARVQGAYRFGAAPHWNEPDGDSTLPAQLEALLGEDSAPDPTFFVESWTMGVAAAAENYQRRQTKKRKPAVPSGPEDLSFLPFFTVEPVTPIAAPPPLSMPLGNTIPEADAMEPPASTPLTFEAACRLLGVALDSTRGQIRAAYRKMATRCHPDRMARRGSHEQKIAGDRMAAINEAYRLLCAARLDPSA